MDLSLPGMDGWEATRVLKADERTKHIPVVALTGHALAGASEGATKAGCDSFVTKPCLPDDLVVEVRRMLDTVKKAVTKEDPTMAKAQKQSAARKSSRSRRRLRGRGRYTAHACDRSVATAARRLPSAACGRRRVNGTTTRR